MGASETKSFQGPVLEAPPPALSKAVGTANICVLGPISGDQTYFKAAGRDQLAGWFGSPGWAGDSDSQSHLYSLGGGGAPSALGRGLYHQMKMEGL
jgi:hypothetical protein